MGSNYNYFLLGLFLLFTLNLSSKPTQDKSCRTLVEKGVEAMLDKKHNTSLELLTQVKDVAQRNDDYSCLFLALNNIGANYFALLDYGEALENYLKAYTIAIKHLDAKSEIIVLNNIAILYSKESQYKKAKEYFLRAYQVAKKEDNKIRIARYATNLGLVSNQMKEVSSALEYFNEALHLLEDGNKLKLEAQLGMADNYLLRDKADEAITLLNKILPELQSLKDKAPIGTGYYLLAKGHEKQNDYEMAKSYARKAISNSESLDAQKEVYNLLASLYQNHGDLEKTIAMKDSLLSVEKQIFSIKNGRLFETNKVKFELKKFQQELEKKNNKLTSERKMYIIIISCILIGVLLLIWAWRNSKIKNEQRKILIQRNKELLALELEKEKSDHLLLEKKLEEKETSTLIEKERLQRKIEKRNRELAAKALQQSNTNEVLKKIIHSLTNHPALKQNKDIKSYVKELNQYLKSDGKWNEFFTHFEEVNPYFLKKITQKHQELNSNDIRFICYLYMNLSTKEIASLFNITPAACRKRKERISSKLSLSSGSDLNTYIFSF